MKKLPKRLFAKIGLVVGEPIDADEVTLAGLQNSVEKLRGQHQ